MGVKILLKDTVEACNNALYYVVESDTILNLPAFCPHYIV